MIVCLFLVPVVRNVLHLALMALVKDNSIFLWEWQWMVKIISLWQIVAIIAYRSSQQMASFSLQSVQKVKDLFSSIVPFNAANNKVYVPDRNGRVQVLNSDLNFHYMFGEEGSDMGQFMIGEGFHLRIACNSAGDVYVLDPYYFRIQVFTAEGEFCNMLEKKVVFPLCIAIDTNDLVYVGCMFGTVSIFTSNGQFIASFGKKPKFESVNAVGVSSDGVVYACNALNNCILNCFDLCHTTFKMSLRTFHNSYFTAFTITSC